MLRTTTVLLMIAATCTACRSGPAGLAETQTAPSGASRTTATRAQNRNPFGAWYRAADPDGWAFDLTAGVELEPDYPGSDDSETEPGFGARAIYKRGTARYALSLGEVGVWIEPAPEWGVGLVLEYEEARENDNDALRGLDEVDATVEGQVTLARRLGDWTLAGVLQPDLLGEGKGFVSFVALGYDRMISENLRLGSSLDISFGDAEHMQTEFGVSTSESSASGLSRYSPGAGLKSSTFELNLEYFLSDAWSLIGAAGAEFYFSRASDSPLIEDEGADLTVEALLGLRYSF